MNLKKGTRGQLIVLSGLPGMGKSTVISRLLSEWESICFSVSFTTYQPWAGEEDDVSYNFVNRKQSESMISGGELLEYAGYAHSYYGTSLHLIEEKLSAGTDVPLNVEVQGAAKARTKCPDAVFVFIIPPSFEEPSRHLYRQATDAEEVVQGRLQKAHEERKQILNYDRLVVNDKVSEATGEIVTTLTAESCRIKHRINLVDGIQSNTILEPPMNQLLKQVPSRCMLVNMVTRQARQVAGEAGDAGTPPNDKPVTITIREVAEGKVEPNDEE